VRRGLLSLSIVLAVGAACVACGAVFDLDALGGGDDGAAPGEPDAGDAATLRDAALLDAADAAAPDLDEDSSAPCVYDAGATMKRIGVYCIDTIETTNAAYETFLERADAGALGAAPLPASCNDSGDRVPTENWLSPPEWVDLPVTGVSWCDAWAFCASAGKRLCGKRGGGALTPSAMTNTDPATNEWYRACSKAGTKRLPYGNEAVPGECATINELRAASGGCQGGYLGIFDLVGNAEEWTNDCASNDPSASCIVQGGSAIDNTADCTTAKPYPRTIKRPLVGFRCCAD
jgi:formylglycine-generating enzyme required for sulfatase activity